jgi:hypothetical protein
MAGVLLIVYFVLDLVLGEERSDKVVDWFDQFLA